MTFSPVTSLYDVIRTDGSGWLQGELAPPPECLVAASAVLLNVGRRDKGQVASIPSHVFVLSLLFERDKNWQHCGFSAGVVFEVNLGYNPKYHWHWWIQGGHCWHTPPRTGSISFIFAYIFTEKCTCQRLAPSPMGRCPPPPMGNPGSATDWCCILNRVT